MLWTRSERLRELDAFISAAKWGSQDAAVEGVI